MQLLILFNLDLLQPCKMQAWLVEIGNKYTIKCLIEQIALNYYWSYNSFKTNLFKSQDEVLLSDRSVKA